MHAIRTTAPRGSVPTLAPRPAPRPAPALVPALVPALALALAACGGTEYETGPGAGPGGAEATVTGTPAAALPVDPYAEGVWQPAPPATTTARLVASPGFDFASARDVPFALDVPEARGTSASLSLCTEWERENDSRGAGYDVDYGSCALRATMVDGYHEGVLALGNQHDTVLAVVWFDDPAAGPVYRELRLEGR